MIVFALTQMQRNYPHTSKANSANAADALGIAYTAGKINTHPDSVKAHRKSRLKKTTRLPRIKSIDAFMELNTPALGFNIK